MRPRRLALLLVPVLLLLSCADPVAPDYGERVTFFEAVDIALAYLEAAGLYENGDNIAFYEVESRLDAEGKGVDWDILLMVNENSYKVLIRKGGAVNHINSGQRDDPLILTEGLLDTDTLMSNIPSFIIIRDEIRFVLTTSTEGYNFPSWESDSFETTMESCNYVGPKINLYFDPNYFVVRGECDFSYYDWQFQLNVYNNSVFEGQETRIVGNSLHECYIKCNKINDNQWSYFGYLNTKSWNEYLGQYVDHECDIINGVAWYYDNYEERPTYNIIIVCDAYDGSYMLFTGEE